MKISQFVIGKTFWVGSRKFRCTDICSHFIAAIELYRRDDPSWYNGPSYAVPEYAFGEPEMEACTPKAVTRAAAKEWRMRKGAKIVESTLSMHSRPPKVSKFPPALSFCPVPKAMELQDFAIGDLFLMSMHIMRCIDVGTRVAVGFDICHAKKRLKGAEGEPYSSEWIVDECDRHACTALYYLSDEELSFFEIGARVDSGSNFKRC